MAWQSTTINPTITTPADDISKIRNDLQVLRGVLGGTADADVPLTAVTGATVNSIAVLRTVVASSRPSVFVLGYYAPGDGGGGWYVYDAGDTTSADNGGTVIVGASNARWKLLHDGVISVQQFGARADGTSDDAPAVSAAAAAVVASTRKGVLTFPAGRRLKMGSSITLNLSYVSLSGNGAELDFSGLASGASAVTVVGKASGTPYGQATNFIDSLIIFGAGPSSGVYGIVFNTASEAGPEHITIRGLITHSFMVGHSFWSNSYCIDFFGGSVYNCGTAISQPGGMSNYGERISYFGATLFNSTVCVDMQNPDGEFNITNSSLDYCGRQVYCTAGRVVLTDCHIEASSYAAAPFYTSGSSGATIAMRGGWLLCTGSNSSVLADSNSTAGMGGGIYFRDVFMNNVSTSRYFASGTGNVDVDGIITYDTPANIPQLLRADLSTMLDGGFEAASPSDVFIVGDTAAITSRLVGTNIKLSSSTTSPRTGSRALAMNKVGGAGTACQFAIVVPLRKSGRFSGFSGYYSKPGAQTGTMYISYSYANLRDSSTTPQVIKSGSAGLVTVVFGAATVGYTSVAGGFDLGKSPKWANSIIIYINADNIGAGVILFDDFEGHEF